MGLYSSPRDYGAMDVGGRVTMGVARGWRGYGSGMLILEREWEEVYIDEI